MHCLNFCFQYLAPRKTKMRLTGTTKKTRGQIEIIEPYKGIIHDAQWDVTDAKVVCREMTFP